ncbi:hypothetical protein BJX61DRAFT_538790 [Aspergillus egyptiacus]|nr:hypothetical protein BJX61DRAFT_538790 [Aspergillus egyptiacus]
MASSIHAAPFIGLLIRHFSTDNGPLAVMTIGSLEALRDDLNTILLVWPREAARPAPSIAPARLEATIRAFLYYALADPLSVCLETRGSTTLSQSCSEVQNMGRKNEEGNEDEGVSLEEEEEEIAAIFWPDHAGNFLGISEDGEILDYSDDEGYESD